MLLSTQSFNGVHLAVNFFSGGWELLDGRALCERREADSAWLALSKGGCQGKEVPRCRKHMFCASREREQVSLQRLFRHIVQ